MINAYWKMKIYKSYIRHLLILLCLTICFQQKILPQGTDISNKRSTNLYVGFSAGPSQTSISNTVIPPLSKLNSIKKNSFSGFLEIGYFFSDNIGLSTGVGFVSDKTQLTLDSYQSSYTTTDTDTPPESYERRVTGSNIKELQKVGFLSIPLCINLRLPISDKSGFFLQTGVNIAVPLTKSYGSSGIFSFEGYYPAYKVLLTNLPAYGFPSNKSIVSGGNLELKSIGFNFVASGGFDFFIQEKIQIAISACYEKSLSNISDYSLPDKFQLSTDGTNINSIMGGSSKTTVQSLGLKITLRYYLR
jgi:hypothetical protein